MERLEVIVISRNKEINKLDLKLEEVEDYYSSDNSIFRKFISPSKLAPIKDINIIYIAVF